MQTVTQCLGHRIGLAIRYAAGCAPQFSKFASWALWLGGASSYIPQVGGARDYVPQLGIVAVQALCLDEATGCVQQSAKAVVWALCPGSLVMQGQRLCFFIWRDCWLGPLPKYGFSIGSIAAQVLWQGFLVRQGWGLYSAAGRALNLFPHQGESEKQASWTAWLAG